jgi:hypothetical protein
MSVLTIKIPSSTRSIWSYSSIRVASVALGVWE